MEEDKRVVPVNDMGQMYWVPYADRKTGAIESYQKWELAFRVYSDVFIRRYPEKSSELIQYNHVIHTALLTYQWGNVYKYDKDFRLHMAKYPLRSWGIILQHSWNLRLKDKVRYGDSNDYRETGQRERGNGNGSGNRGSKREICWRYNSGRCSYGMDCKFDHRCAICMKFGHGAHRCRKAGADYQNNRDRYDKSDRNDRRDDFSKKDHKRRTPEGKSKA